MCVCVCVCVHVCVCVGLCVCERIDSRFMVCVCVCMCCFMYLGGLFPQGDGRHTLALPTFLRSLALFLSFLTDKETLSHITMQLSHQQW